MLRELTPLEVRKMWDYDPVSGLLFWENRDASWFKSESEASRWNKQYALTEALACLRSDGYYGGNHKNKYYLAHRVAWAWMTGEWRAQITVNYKRIVLGHYVDVEDAVAARRAAEIKHNFSELNYEHND